MAAIPTSLRCRIALHGDGLRVRAPVHTYWPLCWPVCVDRSALAETRTEIIGPAGSGQFGASVKVLPNGTILVVDPVFDLQTPTGLVINAGAVYLFDGATLNKLSTLTSGQRPMYLPLLQRVLP